MVKVLYKDLDGLNNWFEAQGERFQRDETERYGALDVSLAAYPDHNRGGGVRIALEVTNVNADLEDEWLIIPLKDVDRFIETLQRVRNTAYQGRLDQVLARRIAKVLLGKEE